MGIEDDLHNINNGLLELNNKFEKLIKVMLDQKEQPKDRLTSKTGDK